MAWFRCGISASASGTDYVVIVNGVSGCTITASKSGTTISGSEISSGVYSVSIPYSNPGTWTIRLEKDGVSGSVTVDVNPEILLQHIPNDYVELEYIEGTGTQYIKTGLGSTNANTGFKITYETRSEVSPSAGGTILGARAGYPSPALTLSYYNNGGSKGTLLANGVYSGGITSFTKETAELKNGVFTGADGVVTNLPNMGNVSDGLSLFAYGNGAEIGKVRIYFCEIYDGDTVVRRFYPAKRKSDNAIGMYDVITDTFKGNSGSGTFVIPS